MPEFLARPVRSLAVLATLAAVSTTACGGGHRLAEFDFADRSMALVYLAPPAPDLLTGRYDLRESENLADLVINSSARVAKDLSATHARARLDSATRRLDLERDLAERTLERTSRYLGLRPVERASEADYLLEVHVRSYGLDARGTRAAYVYSNAEAVLIERRTGHEVWNSKVHGTDRITPYVVGYDGVPGAVITASTLHLVSVDDFQHALEQLVELSSDLIADRLRADLRGVRRSN